MNCQLVIRTTKNTSTWRKSVQKSNQWFISVSSRQLEKKWRNCTRHWYYINTHGHGERSVITRKRLQIKWFNGIARLSIIPQMQQYQWKFSHKKMQPLTPEVHHSTVLDPYLLRPAVVRRFAFQIVWTYQITLWHINCVSRMCAWIWIYVDCDLAHRSTSNSPWNYVLKFSFQIFTARPFGGCALQSYHDQIFLQSMQIPKNGLPNYTCTMIGYYSYIIDVNIAWKNRQLF